MEGMEQMGNSERNPAPDPTILAQAMLLPEHPDWIEKHAADFRNYVEEHPELVEQLKNDFEGTVKKIEKIFYH